MGFFPTVLTVKNHLACLSVKSSFLLIFFAGKTKMILKLRSYRQILKKRKLHTGPSGSRPCRRAERAGGAPHNNSCFYTGMVVFRLFLKLWPKKLRQVYRGKLSHERCLTPWVTTKQSCGLDNSPTC